MGAAALGGEPRVPDFDGSRREGDGGGFDRAEILHTSSAYLTFVAIDQAGNRVPVAPVIPESADEIRRYEDAGKRREYRLALKEKLARKP